MSNVDLDPIDSELVDAADRSEIATRKQQPENLALSSFFGNEMGVRINTFSGSPKEMWRMMAQGRSAAVKKLRDCVKEPLAIKHIACERIEVMDNDGQLCPAIRTVLYCHDGSMYATVADGVARSVQEIFQIFGKKELPEDFIMVAEEVTTRRGFRVLQLMPVM